MSIYWCSDETDAYNANIDDINMESESEDENDTSDVPTFEEDDSPSTIP